MRHMTFTTATLYNKILCRIQNWMPSGREMQKPPLHVMLTQNPRLPQSIQLSPIHRSVPTQAPPIDPSLNTGELLNPHSTIDMSVQSILSTSEPDRSGNLSQDRQAESSNSSISDPQLPSPAIVLSIRLKETMSASQLNGDYLADWLQMIPLVAEHVKVEAGFFELFYTSFSYFACRNVVLP